MMPIIDEQEAVFFERPFRAQSTKALHDCGHECRFPSMPWRLARAALAISAAVARGEPVEHFSAPGQFSSGTHRPFCGARADSNVRYCSSSHLERLSEPEQGSRGLLVSSVLARPSGLERASSRVVQSFGDHVSVSLGSKAMKSPKRRARKPRSPEPEARRKL